MTARWRALLGLATSLALAAGCGGNGTTDGGPTPTPTPSGPTRPVPVSAEALLAEMTLAEKVGQMTQADRQFLASDRDITTFFLGSLLSGGGSAPAQNDATGWADMYDRYQQAALATRLQIPLLYGIDAVHGHNNVRGAVIFPHNIGMGCTRNPALVEEAARVTAEEVAGTGIDWTFSPCIAVPRDERWGRTYEGFGETPELAQMMAPAAVRGYQSTALAAPSAILACAKHFIGDGGTEGGHDQGDTILDEATLRQIHLPGYVAAIQAGVGSVMISFSSWNGQKLHGNSYLINSVLKGELGFTGFVVSDWGGIDQLPGDFASDVETSVNAGIDMVMVPDRYQSFIATLTNLVEQGRVPISRIDDAVLRILRKKLERGLFAAPYTDRALTATVGSAAHRSVARRCVRESVVLLANDTHLLPLAKGARIHVAGKNADDLGNQCGGWTISWQGNSGAITEGTTILAGIREATGASNVTYSRDGSGAAGASVGVVVIGETPYAEGQGDRQSLELATEDVAAVNAVRAAGVPVVVVLVSGRPMILEPIRASASAIVAAWLPGTEGGGVADVLFGDQAPSGRLSHSWPRAMSDIPINVGDAFYSPLFPYDHGLDYR